MSGHCCGCEDRVREALAVGELDEELAEHVASCPLCCEVVLVVSALRQMVDDGADPLPDPSAIWMRAELARRADAARRALLPVVVVQRVAASLAALAAVVAAVLWRSRLGAWLAGLELPPLPRLPEASALTHPSAIALVAAGVLVTLAVLELTASSAEG